MWLEWYLLFILPVWRLQDLLPAQYSSYICVRCPDIYLAGTATLPAPTVYPSPLPWALAVWHVTEFWSEWVRLSRLGPAPARSYRMCMLDVFSAGQGWRSQGKTQQTHSFTTSQNIISTLPSHQRPSQSFYLTKLNMYTTTVHPSQRELTWDRLQLHFL